MYVEVAQEDLDALHHPDNLMLDDEKPARFIYVGASRRDTVENVGFRLRGNTSRNALKKSYRVSFNTFAPGGKYRGLEKLNLNGEHNDPTIIRSNLAWDIFQKMGVPASRATHVKLYINDVYYGLYALVEHIDEQFLQERFDDDSGNLYKCLWPADLTYLGPDAAAYRPDPNADIRRPYDLKGKDDDSEGYDDLARLIEVLNRSSNAEFPAALDAVFDINGYLRVMAVDVAVGSWDNYWFLKNNYYLYFDPTSGKAHLIPYDYDNTFGIDWVGGDWGTRDIYRWGHPDEQRPLTERLLAVPVFRDRYSFYLRKALSFLESGGFDAEVDRLRAKVTAAAEADTFRTRDWGYTVDAFHRSFGEALGGHAAYGLQPYAATRFQTALSQLENVDVAPILSYGRHEPRNPQTGTPIRFEILVEDEVPETLTVEVRSSTAGQEQRTLDLKDDGQNGDRVAGDGYYTGIVSAIDVEGSVIYTFAARDQTGKISTSRAVAFSVGFDDPGIVINELMASNRTTLADEFGEFDDWVEIYNTGSAPVNLGDYYLSDDFARPDRWRMPDVVSGPGEHVVLWLDGQPEQGPLHAPFRLNRDGEQLGIFSGPDNGFFPLDTLSYGPQVPDLSLGRLNDGDHTIEFLVPTPGSPNPGVPAVALSGEAPPGIELLSAYPNPFSENATIQISLSEPGLVDIRVHDVLGREVAVLASAMSLSPGPHRFPWIASTRSGVAMPAGLYMIRATLDGPTRRSVQTAFLAHLK